MLDAIFLPVYASIYSITYHKERNMAKIARKEKELQVGGPNKLGTGAAIFGALREARVNVAASCCYSEGSRAKFLLVVNKIPQARRALRKAGYQVESRDVILARLPNRAGIFSKLLERVAAARVDVDYSYASATGKSALVVLKTSSDQKAIKAINR